MVSGAYLGRKILLKNSNVFSETPVLTNCNRPLSFRGPPMIWGEFKYLLQSSCCPSFSYPKVLP